MPRTKLSECGKKRKLLSVSRHWSARASIFLSFALCSSVGASEKLSESNFIRKKFSKSAHVFCNSFFSSRPFRIQFKVRKQSYSKILETSRMPEANWNNTYFISMFAIFCWVLLEVTSPCLCATRRHAIKFQFALMPSLEIRSFRARAQ